MRPSRRILVALVAVVSSVGMTEVASSAPNITVERLSGATRYGTAAAIAAEDEFFWQGAVLVRGDDFPDGLTATNLARDWPLLLTERDQLPQETQDVIRREGINGMYIVGGEGAVSSSVEKTLQDQGIDITRVAGENRYATAAATYSRVYSYESDFPREFDGQTTILLASGENFADALAASPLAQDANLPILLTQRDRLPQETRAWIDPGGCANGICVEQVIILGGTSAISPSVEAELRSIGLATRRLQGPDRYSTAAAVARFARDELSWSITHFNLTRGDNFPDALAAGFLGGVEHAPTLLTVGPDELGAVTRDFIRENRSTVASFHVLGDATAVNDAVVADAHSATSG